MGLAPLPPVLSTAKHPRLHLWSSPPPSSPRPHLWFSPTPRSSPPQLWFSSTPSSPRAHLWFSTIPRGPRPVLTFLSTPCGSRPGSLLPLNTAATHTTDTTAAPSRTPSSTPDTSTCPHRDRRPSPLTSSRAGPAPTTSSPRCARAPRAHPGPRPRATASYLRSCTSPWAARRSHLRCPARRATPSNGASDRARPRPRRGGFRVGP